MSQLICKLLPEAPTNGDPTIVESIQLHNDISDCHCRKLIICVVACNGVAALLQVTMTEPFKVTIAFRFAMHWAVAWGNMKICIEGILTGWAFFDSVKDKVYRFISSVMIVMSLTNLNDLDTETCGLCHELPPLSKPKSKPKLISHKWE